MTPERGAAEADAERSAQKCLQLHGTHWCGCPWCIALRALLSELRELGDESDAWERRFFESDKQNDQLRDETTALRAQLAAAQARE